MPDLGTVVLGLVVVVVGAVVWRAAVRVEPERAREGLRRAVKLAMVDLMLADGRTDPEEVDVVREAYFQVTGARLSEMELMREVRRVESGRTSPREALAELADDFDESDRALVVTAAIMVALSDAEIQVEENEHISDIVEAVGMTPAELDRLLTGMGN